MAAIRAAVPKSAEEKSDGPEPRNRQTFGPRSKLRPLAKTVDRRAKPLPGSGDAADLSRTGRTFRNNAQLPQSGSCRESQAIPRDIPGEILRCWPAKSGRP